MSEIQAEIEEINVSILELEKAVERKEALERLMKNEDFKTLIEGDYMRDEAVRLTTLLGSPNPPFKDMQEYIIKDLEGIAAIGRYFSNIFTLANQAQEQITAHKVTLDEIRGMADDTAEEGEG